MAGSARLATVLVIAAIFAQHAAAVTITSAKKEVRGTAKSLTLMVVIYPTICPI